MGVVWLWWNCVQTSILHYKQGGKILQSFLTPDINPSDFIEKEHISCSLRVMDWHQLANEFIYILNLALCFGTNIIQIRSIEDHGTTQWFSKTSWGPPLWSEDPAINYCVLIFYFSFKPIVYSWTLWAKRRKEKKRNLSNKKLNQWTVRKQSSLLTWTLTAIS